jgi:methyl-accepting chemotaxis protein
VEYARRLEKRFVTVLYRPVSADEMHSLLRRVQWLDFSQHDGDFYKYFSELVRTLDTDREHVHSHTKWSLRALEWKQKDKSVDLLLQGSELTEAQAWLTETEQNHKQPPATELQKAYFSAAQAKIKRQLRRGQLLKALAVFLIVLFVVVTTVYSGQIASELGQDALTKAAFSHLATVRDSKKAQVEDYFDNVFTQIKVSAESITTIQAMRGFKETYPEFTNKADAQANFDFIIVEEPPASPVLSIEEYQEVLIDYYTNDFAAEYGSLNYETPDMNYLIHQLDDNSIALQYFYIAANPNPLGTKEEYFAAGEFSSYTQLHEHYHRYFHNMQRRFGFEDIFLVDIESGHVIYSVSKQIDFATSVKDGPFAKTGLGLVVEMMRQSSLGEISLVDFKPYLPSYDNPVAFVGTPIFEEDKRLGVLIFQLSFERINDIMTNRRVWGYDEFGRTGEVYLVAADGTLRNDSRMFIENKEDYLSAVNRRLAGLSKEVIPSMELKDTTVGLQRVDTPSVRAAFYGVTGFDYEEGYLGEFVLSAYTPINVPGLRWAIFSTLTEEEAIEKVDTLVLEINRAILSIILPIPIILYFIFLFSSMLFGSRLFRKGPVNKT